jgi:acylphosphatase
MRYRVSGKVQGVFFRASTRFEAEQLKITGYARNLADGRVEVLACGEAEAVDQLRSWLTRGPPNARVEGVSSEPVPARELADFTID